MVQNRELKNPNASIIVWISNYQEDKDLFISDFMIIY